MGLYVCIMLWPLLCCINTCAEGGAAGRGGRWRGSPAGHPGAGREQPRSENPCSCSLSVPPLLIKRRAAPWGRRGKGGRGNGHASAVHPFFTIFGQNITPPLASGPLRARLAQMQCRNRQWRSDIGAANRRQNTDDPQPYSAQRSEALLSAPMLQLLLPSMISPHILNGFGCFYFNSPFCRCQSFPPGKKGISGNPPCSLTCLS